MDITNLIITPEILNLIAEIDEFKGAWQEMRQLTPDRLSTLKKVATIESIGSSTRIEGAKLSDSEVERLLTSLKPESFQTRDEQEVGGYALVCQEICENYSSIPLTENTIRQLHSWLLQYTDKDTRHRGEYKKIPIRIEAFDGKGISLGTVFETTSPLETPIKMEELVNWTNKSLEIKELHPLLTIAIFVVLFLAIHPFQDGNGRLSRLLTTLLMLKTGYSYCPYSSLESIIEANKESYYLALQKTQKSWQNHRPDWNPWILFFLNCLKRQKQHLEVKLDREKVIAKTLSPLAEQIINLLTSHGRLKIGQLTRLTKSNRNNLKKVLSSLVEDNYISRHGAGKATHYSVK